MINEEKVKSMTKAAVYESGKEKKNIEITNYYRGDYLGLQMVKSAIAYIVAFFALTLLWGMGNLERLMLKFSQPDYAGNLLTVIAVIFAIGLVVYEFLVYAYYSSKYDQAKQSVGEYQEYLKEIYKFYDADNSKEDELVEIDLSDEENEL